MSRNRRFPRALAAALLRVALVVPCLASAAPRDATVRSLANPTPLPLSNAAPIPSTASHATAVCPAVYANTTHSSGYYYAAGAFREVLDDLHLAPGPSPTLCGFDVTYHKSTPGLVDMKVTFYANTPSDAVPGGILAGPFHFTGLPPGSQQVHFDVPGTPLTPDVWMGVSFSTDSAGPVIMNPPTLGTSHDVFYQYPDNQYYFFGGNPIASFGLSVYGSSAGGRPGDHCGNTILITTLPFSTLDSTSNALDDFLPSTCVPTPPSVGVGPDLVYRFELQSAQPESVVFYVSPHEDWDVVLYTTSPTCGPGAPCQALANNAGPGMPEVVTLWAQPYQPYYVVVDGVGGDRGAFVLSCALYVDACSRLTAPPLHSVRDNGYRDVEGVTGGKRIDIITVPKPRCSVVYKDRNIFQESWARSGTFKDMDLKASSSDIIDFIGNYKVSRKAGEGLVPCSCSYAVFGRHLLNAWPSTGYASGIGVLNIEVEPFFPRTLVDDLNQCFASEEEGCRKDTSWFYWSPSFNANVAPETPNDVDLTFQTRATAMGKAAAYTEINTFRLYIDCPDPPEDGAVTARGGAAKQPEVSITIGGLELRRHPLVQAPTASVPPPYTWAFIPVDSTHRPPTIAASAGFGFGSAVYLTNDVAMNDVDLGSPADTSRIISYQGGVLSSFGAGVLYGPSALEFDRSGGFGHRLFAAAADSFSLGSGTPIRGRGVINAVDAAGVVTRFAGNLDSPVGLAFGLGAPWSGLYVVEKWFGAVDWLTPAGATLPFLNGLRLPMDLAFGTGSFGNLLYVVEADTLGPDTLAHSDAGRIVAFTSGGTRSELVGALHYPTSIVRATPGGSFGDYLYVSLYNQFDADNLPIPLTGRVARVDPLGHVTVFADSLEQPMDLTFAPTGELIVTVAGGLVQISTSAATGVEVRPSFPLRLEVAPNPSSIPARVRFTLPGARVVDLSLFDLSGRRIATIAKGNYEAGPHHLVWAGTDEAGRHAPAGLYMIRLRTSRGEVLSRSVLRIR